MVHVVVPARFPHSCKRSIYYSLGHVMIEALMNFRQSSVGDRELWYVCVTRELFLYVHS